MSLLPLIDGLLRLDKLLSLCSWLQNLHNWLSLLGNLPLGFQVNTHFQENWGWSQDLLWSTSPHFQKCNSFFSKRLFGHFRYVLLGISLACVAVTIILMILVYKYRKLKVISYPTIAMTKNQVFQVAFQVFKLASPVFLCITLLGCSVMYLEVSEFTVYYS